MERLPLTARGAASLTIRAGHDRLARKDPVTTPGAADDTSHAADDAACWQQVRQLRQAHNGWVIIWLAPARQYRAYRRLPGARRDTTLAAETPDALAALIIKAGQATPQARRDQRSQR
jgi:hypothetical protein